MVGMKQRPGRRSGWLPTQHSPNVIWDFTYDMLKNADHCQLGLAASPIDSQMSCMRTRELAIAQLNPRSACRLTDMVAGNWLEFTRVGRASRVASRDWLGAR